MVSFRAIKGEDSMSSININTSTPEIIRNNYNKEDENNFENSNEEK